MKKLFLLVMLSILVLACENETNGDYVHYFGENSITIPTTIDIMPVEAYENYNTPSAPSLKLFLTTRWHFNCANYILVTTQFKAGNELIIRFEDVVLNNQENICLTASGPAQSYIDLPEDITKLVFINGQTIDTYQIATNDELVSISLIESNFTTSLYDNTFRYPENTFAYSCGANLENLYTCDDFLAILLNDPAFTEYEFNGEGRIPYPAMGHHNYPSRYFSYTTEADFDTAVQLLNDYVTQNNTNDGISISLTSWNNKYVYSGMFN